ncbi:hypothetical protein [Streptomyces sp. NPDC046939]|uniref:hypothetical protein n=1 Tax=Streptomyces sp. NPDC046939 TaxID=3155376 RepID=UPI0034084997
MLFLLLATTRRRIGALGVLVGLCLFAWWALQPVGPVCPEGLSLSSDPWGSTYDPAGDIASEGSYSTIGSGGDEPCAAETRHPRLYGWLGL